MKWVFRAGLLMVAFGFFVGLWTVTSIWMASVMIMLLGIGLMLFAMPFFLRVSVVLQEQEMLPPSDPPSENNIQDQEEGPDWGDVPGKPFEG